VVAKTKQQFELRNAEELQKIQNNINTIIKQFATANDFDLILYKDIAFVSKKIDITDKISEKLNK
jgi:Skp family chaperone for outer membrane proteins